MLTHSLVSLILRLALGAIFIYHGYCKVAGPHNYWGPSWATNQWQIKPSQDVLDKLEKLAGKVPDEIRILQEDVRGTCSKSSPPVPAALQSPATPVAAASWDFGVG